MMTCNRRDFLRAAGVGAAAAALPGLAAPTHPNIIWIMADDLGYGDLSCLNEGSKIQTPNMDRMAGQGVRLWRLTTTTAFCPAFRAKAWAESLVGLLPN